MLTCFVSLFWTARVGILNYASDIHEFILSGQVNITRKDIDHLSSPGILNLVDGTKIQSDALIGITGWNLTPTIEYKPKGLEASLGIPCKSLSPEEEELWKILDSQADDVILNQYPALRYPPAKKLPYSQGITPYRLYRGVAPPGLTARGDHSIAFIKMVHSTGNITIAETQALWIYAYLNHKLPIDRENVYRETAFCSRFGVHRYPCGFACFYPEFVYDTVPYADMMLSDLGVASRRKPTLRQELFEGYTCHDYKGINGEWKKLQTKGLTNGTTKKD